LYAVGNYWHMKMFTGDLIGRHVKLNQLDTDILNSQVLQD